MCETHTSWVFVGLGFKRFHIAVNGILYLFVVLATVDVFVCNHYLLFSMSHLIKVIVFVG